MTELVCAFIAGFVSCAVVVFVWARAINRGEEYRWF